MARIDMNKNVVTRKFLTKFANKINVNSETCLPCTYLYYYIYAVDGEILVKNMSSTTFPDEN